ncbi:MAG: hypothetical protein A2504_03640 [Bdellovibrionales bacterium RIFOXYD12_FULL_39_22]|nr:MAG: hypothetical protein A2385_11390 [Bdellovibrionales bacterium RIFOXYB1_FULL_39_21]OFZ41670.1 MAG: hypothetical protein A2485_01700 [Bdellovibrionales bacterium RIFOXYC12_FULL_39_17]OFZ46070.1 MAG: hypothetical protein A2404_12065 [Bdellovibrionales bacterium RIFOXYC1_FULL_39_130]OFZ69300.1 MAG: hypothetical protein A2451_00915 [Bdellovibrionales bacterium RIFOXYC2_FULL_39_8]OFZ74897.1 MAG: hypothetical protein A2560_15105 [Bdellovibrionales bacterium RIFOXYD1_FULL_39_84]OFZ92750.1 MAG:
MRTSLFLLALIAILGRTMEVRADFLGNDTSFLQANYRFSSVSNDFDYTENYHNFNVNLLKRKNAVLHGSGVSYGTAQNTFVIEGVYNLYAAVTDVIKTFPVVPYAGMQLGIGYHQFTGADKKDYHEFEPADSDFNDFEQILYNFIVARFVGGVLIGINEDIGANIFIAKNLTMDRDLGIGGGLNLKF